MEWDDLEDLVVVATQDVFGRAVTYTPAGGSSQPLTGVFTTADQFSSQELGGHEAGFPRMEFRTADLVVAGITPTSGDKTALSGDLLSFEVAGEARTYRVIKVVHPDQSTTMLHLARVP